VRQATSSTTVFSPEPSQSGQQTEPYRHVVDPVLIVPDTWPWPRHSEQMLVIGVDIAGGSGSGSRSSQPNAAMSAE
jgi:hypothetical protein